MTAKNQIQQRLQGLDNRLWPELNITDKKDNELTFTFVVEQHLQPLQGHFPQQAVLPGVAQLHWAASLAQLAWNISLENYQINNTKFKQMILPDNHVQLKLVHKPEKNTVAFSYFQTATDHSYSSGSITYGART